MTLDRERLHDILAELATRPGHEKVRALTLELLVNGLGVPSRDVDFERPLPEVRGRADALLGQTVFEFKRDLRREHGDAEEELSRYLADRERQSGLQFIGIATDGAEFAPYELRRDRLVRLPGISLTKERRSELSRGSIPRSRSALISIPHRRRSAASSARRLARNAAAAGGNVERADREPVACSELPHGVGMREHSRSIQGKDRVDGAPQGVHVERRRWVLAQGSGPQHGIEIGAVIRMAVADEDGVDELGTDELE